MRRLFAFLAASAAFAGVYQLGSYSEIGEAERAEFMEEFGALIEGIGAADIFFHNGFITAVMFVPGLGVAWGLFSAWSTGYAFAAIAASSSGALEGVPAAAILLTPFGAMELAAYSLAISRSALFAHALIGSRQAAGQIRPLAIDAGIAAALLAAGAVIEAALIGAIEAPAQPA